MSPSFRLRHLIDHQAHHREVVAVKDGPRQKVKPAALANTHQDRWVFQKHVGVREDPCRIPHSQSLSAPLAVTSKEYDRRRRLSPSDATVNVCFEVIRRGERTNEDAQAPICIPRAFQ